MVITRVVILRLVAIAAAVAGAVLLALYADDNLGNVSDLGWGWFCVAVALALFLLEGIFVVERPPPNR